MRVVYGLTMVIWTGLLAAQDLPTMRSVDIFKDGNAFFIHEGKVRLNSGEASLKPVPWAAFGTFWLAPLESGVQLEDIRTRSEREVRKRRHGGVLDVLKANLGRKMIWSRHADNTPPLSGILQEVTGTEDRMVAILKSGTQTHVLSVSAYSDHLEFPDGYHGETTDTVDVASLAVRTNSSKPEIGLQMVYFQSQLGWTPSYRIELVDDRKAQIVLAATVVNDAQDIDDARVNLVVGFPRFLYGHVRSPLTFQQSWTEFMQALSGSEYGYSGRRYQSVMANQSIAYGLGEISAADYGGFEAREGKSEEDLFFYAIPKLALKKGQRGQYNLFSATVPYRHIFEVSLPNGLTAGYDQNKEPAEVWHSVRLENTSRNPWTTGSAMTLQNGKPLGQDVLKYTPVGSSMNVKITQSPDIQVTDEEKETDRKEDVKKKDGYYYDLVTINGEVTIANRKDKDIMLSVTRPITGKVLSSGQAKVTTQARISSAVNAENVAVWEVSVKAGGEARIAYTYETYLRR